MPDTNTQEINEKDPVGAIRLALQSAVSFLKGLLKREDEELKEELEEVEEEKPLENQPAEGGGT